MKKKDEIKDKGFYVKTNEKIHTAFKMRCVSDGMAMTEVIEKLMIKYGAGSVNL